MIFEMCMCGESKILEQMGYFEIHLVRRAKLDDPAFLNNWIAVEEESLKHREPPGASHGTERCELSRSTATHWRESTLENESILSLGSMKESDNFAEVL